MADLVTLLHFLIDQAGSDLLVKVGSAPHVRRDGKLIRTELAPMSPAEIEQLAAELLPEDSVDALLEKGEVDVAHSVSGLGRFRVNVYRQRGSVSLSMRHVMPGTPSMSDLGLPNIVERLANEESGMILIAGPAVSGRTTTAAAIIDHINSHQAKHIVTIEDPIEVLHTDKVGVVCQREVGTDTVSVEDALRRVGRQHPDVVFVSGLDSSDAVAEALRCAGSGRLVVSIMDTLCAAESVQALVDLFPPHRQDRVREQVAHTLRGVIAQKLLEKADGRGRVPAVEVLVNTAKVRDGIAAGMHELEVGRLIAEGEYHGMSTFDQSLFQLHRTGTVSLRDALAGASAQEDLRIAFQQAGLHA